MGHSLAARAAIQIRRTEDCYIGVNYKVNVGTATRRSAVGAAQANGRVAHTTVAGHMLLAHCHVADLAAEVLNVRPKPSGHA